MPVMVIIRAPKVTAAQYEAARSRIGWLETPAIGAISHAIAFTEAGAVEVNLWEDRQSFETYAATRLAPVIKDLGITLDDVQVFDTYTVAIGEPAFAYLIPPAAAAAKASAFAPAH